MNRPGFLDDFEKIFVLSLGLDGVNCFKHAIYSVWVIGAKIYNVHPTYRTSMEYILPNTIIPGPGKPSDLGAYLQPTFRDAQANGNQ